MYQILKEEKEQREQAPEILQKEMNTQKIADNTTPSTNPSGKRSFSTFARRRPDMQTASTPMEMPLDMPMSIPPPISYAVNRSETHQSPLPPVETHHKLRSIRKDQNPDIVTQLTNLIMRDGKKSVAQRNMAVILNTLRTLPAPTINTTRPMLPGVPAATHLSLYPIEYLTAAVDSVAPLMRIRSQRGAAGGGVALQIPVPLGKKQRRRTAFMWIVDAASKKQNRGSGRDTFPIRVAQEIVSVVEGKSGVWEKRNAVHRLATVSRTNVNYRMPGFRR